MMTTDELAHVRRLDAAKSARYRQSEKGKRTVAEWRDKSGRKYQTAWQASKRAWQPKTIRPLTDGYVRHVLTSRSTLHPSEIPTSLVTIQRDHLQLKRELRKTK